MTDPSMALTPDDEQQPSVELREKHHVEQPYGLASLSIGLLVLLVLRAALHTWPLFAVLGITMVVVTVIYLLLSGTRPKLHLPTFTILAAVMALLYSLPETMVYYEMWKNVNVFTSVLSWVVLTSIAAIVFSYGLDAEKQPEEVIGISFLTIFVFTNIVYAVMVH